MPARRKQQVRDTPAIADVPRAGFTCQHYGDGHNVHYVPVTQLVPGLQPLHARLSNSGDALSLTIEQEHTPVYSHNTAAIGALISDFGPACLWYPTLHLACWPRPAERHWASLAPAPIDPCFSAEDAYLAELRHWS